MKSLTDLPSKWEIWRHTRSGRLYLVEGVAFNTITDMVDVYYMPLARDADDYELYSRQIIGHPKAWVSTNEQGEPRFVRIEGEELKALLR